MIISVICAVLRAFQIVMIVAAVISWIPDLQGGRLHSIVSAITEPVISPVRNLLSNISALDNLPIDISFLIVYLLLTLIIRILYVI